VNILIFILKKTENTIAMRKKIPTCEMILRAGVFKLSANITEDNLDTEELNRV
jgi:hypothetical protein